MSPQRTLMPLSMLNPNIIQALINFGASAVGALIAGYAGVWFGIARLRRERGFDQRLTWLRDMIQALHGVARSIDAIGQAGTIEAMMPLFDSTLVDPRIERFDVLVAEARAYASSTSLSALHHAATTFRARSAAPVLNTPSELRAELAHQLEALRRASEALCDDVRQHLGLEPALLSSWPFSIPEVLLRGIALPPAR